MLMSGKQLSLDSRMDLVQRLVTDKNGSGSTAGESVEVLESPSEYDEGNSINYIFFKNQLIQ